MTEAPTASQSDDDAPEPDTPSRNPAGGADATDHPVGEEQAHQNRENESPA